MYRVELKAIPSSGLSSPPFRSVPNVPCGVESYELCPLGDFSHLPKVPNVPCGVESYERENFTIPVQRVPNVPCGVEREGWLEGG